MKDFRNRAKWKETELAVEEMLVHTSVTIAPWHVVPANNRKYARINAMSAIVDPFSDVVDLSSQHLDQRTLDAAGQILGLIRS